MKVVPLRNPAALLRSVRQLIPFDHGDGLVELGEHPGGEQTAQPRATDNGSLTELAQRRTPLAHIPQRGSQVKGRPVLRRFFACTPRGMAERAHS